MSGLPHIARHLAQLSVPREIAMLEKIVPGVTRSARLVSQIATIVSPQRSARLGVATLAPTMMLALVRPVHPPINARVRVTCAVQATTGMALHAREHTPTTVQ